MPHRHHPSYPWTFHLHLHVRENSQCNHRHHHQGARGDYTRCQPTSHAQPPIRPEPPSTIHQRHARDAARIRHRGCPRHRRKRDAHRLQEPQHRRRPPPPRPHRRLHDPQRRLRSIQPHRPPCLHKPFRENELRDDGGLSPRCGP